MGVPLNGLVISDEITMAMVGDGAGAGITEPWPGRSVGVPRISHCVIAQQPWTSLNTAWDVAGLRGGSRIHDVGDETCGGMFFCSLHKYSMDVENQCLPAYALHPA